MRSACSGALHVQVSDLTGSFRLYRKAVLVDLVKDCTSKGCVLFTL